MSGFYGEGVYFVIIFLGLYMFYVLFIFYVIKKESKGNFRKVIKFFVKIKNWVLKGVFIILLENVIWVWNVENI